MRYLFFSGQDILVPVEQSSTGEVPALEEAPGTVAAVAAIAEGAKGRRDFDFEETRYAALMLDEAGAEAALALGLRRMTLREALAEYSPGAMGAALRGVSLLRWLEGALFCGACGSPLADKDPGTEDYGGRACVACGRVHFPRISPAVIVLIRRGRHALLARNARFKPGFFGLIAGFVEAGETLEEAAAREAMEEAGVEIRDLRYVKSQPWPFPDSLMIAFTAEWVSGEARPDGVEIAELRWCLPSELPDIPPKGSVARYLLDEFAKETAGL